MPVAVSLAVIAALVRPGADHCCRLGFEERLRGKLDVDDVDVTSSVERVEQFAVIKSCWATGVNSVVTHLQGHVEIHSGGGLGRGFFA